MYNHTNMNFKAETIIECNACHVSDGELDAMIWFSE